MASHFSFGTPVYWRERAEQSRAMAEDMEDPEAKRAMLDVGESYEKIAICAEIKTVGRPPSFSKSA